MIVIGTNHPSHLYLVGDLNRQCAFQYYSLIRQFLRLAQIPVFLGLLFQHHLQIQQAFHYRPLNFSRK